MNLGVHIQPGSDGKHYVNMIVVDGMISIEYTLTNEDNYEHDIDEVIRQLKNIKNDMRQIKSGIITVREVPDGLRPSATQGRSKRG